MTYQDCVDIMLQLSPQEIMEVVGLDEDVEALVEALGDHIEFNQDRIIKNLTEVGLI